MKNIVICTAGYIEPVLCSLREKIEEKQAGKHLDGTLVGLCVYLRFALLQHLSFDIISSYFIMVE